MKKFKKDLKTDTAIRNKSSKVGLLPVKVKAPNSLAEFNELVTKFKKEHNATDEMSIVATVVFTIRDLT